MVGALAVGIIFIPLERLFYDALGFRMNMALVVRAPAALLTLLPLLTLTSRKSLAKLSCLFLLVSAGLAVWAVLGN